MFISIKWRRSYDAFSYLDRALLDAAVGEDVARAPPHLLVHALLRANEQRFVSFRSVSFQTETSRFKKSAVSKATTALLSGLVIYLSVKRSILGLTE